MYPNVTDFLNDLFGTQLQFPIRTFGFFVALAFIAAYTTIKAELRRRTELGHFPKFKEKILVKAVVKPQDIAIQALIWGLIGYKLGFYFIDAEAFNRDPAGVLFSIHGNVVIGLIAAVVAGAIRFYQYNKTKGQKEEYEEKLVGPDHYMGTVLMMAFIGGILGAKVFHILENLGDFSKHPMEMITSMDGLTFYGGLITAGAMIIFYWKKKGVNLWTMLDSFTPSLMLAYGVGRMGCQMAGDGDWGIANPNPKPGWLSWLPDWAWSFHYPGNVLGQQVNEAGELITRPLADCINPNPKFCFELIEGVYPTPLYEVIMALGIFAILWFVLRKRLKLGGLLTGIYLVFNGLERFLIEKIRINTKYHIGSMEITQAEIISFVLILAGLSIITYVLVKKPVTNPLVAGKKVKKKVKEEEKSGK